MKIMKIDRPLAPAVPDGKYIPINNYLPVPLADRRFCLASPTHLGSAAV